MSVIHLKKKDIVKLSVKGVEIEFDHEKMATILGVPGTNGICEYIKDVWEQSRYTKPLEIIRRFANDENLTEARRVKSGELKPFQRFIHFLGEEPKRYDYFEETFLTMCKLRREDGVWWIGSGENRRRDDDVDAPEEEAEEEEEWNQADFDWEAVVNEATVEGESGSGEKFYDAEDKDQGSPEVNDEIPAVVTQDSAQQKEKESSGVDPLCPTGRIRKSVMLKFQAEFERTRANRFQDDLEKAQAENARLLALLHQTQSKPKP
ncbi:hypothetical protein Dimus_003445 [Dionaea muscipula]